MYIGKTTQNTVRERIEQHKTDNIGYWASAHPHHIDFFEVFKEEDMNYIESYLIRKHTPPHNIIFADNSKMPPFQVIVDESIWISLEEFEAEQKRHQQHLKEVSTLTIQERLLKIEEANKDFQMKSQALLDRTSPLTLQCLQQILECEKNSERTIQLEKSKIEKTIYDAKTLTFAEVLLELQELGFFSRVPGTINKSENIFLFEKVAINGECITFTLSDNAHLLKPMFQKNDV